MQAFAQVYKDGKPVGIFAKMTIASDGRSVLEMENIGGSPSAKDPLA